MISRKEQAGTGRWTVNFTTAVTVAALGLAAAAPAQAQIVVHLQSLECADETPAEAAGEIAAALASGLQPNVTVSQELAVGGQQVHALAQGRFSQLGQVFEFNASLTLAPSGAALGQTSQRCDLCTWAEALDMVTRAGQALRPFLPGLLTVTTLPDEAEAVVDGAPLPANGALAPGTHQLVTGGPGLQRELETIHIAPATSTTRTVQLEPVAPEPGPTPSGKARALAIGAWVSGGLSLGTLVPGIALLALNGQCRDDTFRRGTVACNQEYETLEAGAALTAVAGALLVSTIVLWVLSYRERRRHRGTSHRGHLPAIGGTRGWTQKSVALLPFRD
jgi:hypothetical protein